MKGPAYILLVYFEYVLPSWSSWPTAEPTLVIRNPAVNEQELNKVFDGHWGCGCSLYFFEDIPPVGWRGNTVREHASTKLKCPWSKHQEHVHS